MCIFAVESVLDSVRVVLAYLESPSLKEYIPTSDAFVKRQTAPYVELQPTNVYEDLTRSYLVVGMVFATQLLLMAFVAIDLYNSPTMTCPDGTVACPVGGTLGSLVGLRARRLYGLGVSTGPQNFFWQLGAKRRLLAPIAT